jgi:hydrogenase maturation protease
MRRVLVACMGNAIRGDDGFGPAVARALAPAGRVPEHVEVAEFGIAGVALVQRLLDGYDGIILVDATECGRPPGTIVELEPSVPDVGGRSWDELQRLLGDMHDTQPARVLLMARSLGCLPPRVRILGCQPETVDAGTELSPAVAAAVENAVGRIDAIVGSWRASFGEMTATGTPPR